MLTIYSMLTLLSVEMLLQPLRIQAQTLSPGTLNQSVVFVPTGLSFTINLTSATAGSGCTGTGSYSWWMGATTASAVQIGGNTANLMYTGTWSANTSIWRLYSCSSGGSVYTSSPLTVVAEPPFTPGTVSPATQTIASGATPATLSATASTGGNYGPSYTYQWQTSTDDVNWTNVGSSSTTDPSYSPGPLTVTTYFRQSVLAGPLTMYTNVATVNILTALNAGSATPASTSVLYGANGPTLSLSGVSGGSGPYSYQWETSIDNSSWSAISGAASATYQPLDITGKHYYMCYVTSGTTTLASASAVVFLQGEASTVPAADNLAGSPNTNMNWIMATGYDNLGNIHSQIKDFYDVAGRLLQTQNKVFYRSNPGTVYTHVLASETIRDVYGRDVASTLSAPTDYADFNYIANFVPAQDGSNYTYKNFDRFNPSGTESDLTMSPQGVGGQSTKGTLGWYYGPNNTWEPYTPTTIYPYSRQTIYKDGTNSGKKQGGTGEAFYMGSNHESSNSITPVSGELGNYLQVRNRFFTAAQMGVMATSLQNNAIQTINVDANGTEVVTISDRAGRTLMTGLPGTDLTYTNTVSVAALPAVPYSQQVSCVPGSSFMIQTLEGDNNINIYLVASGGTLSSIYTGSAAGVPLNTTIAGAGTLVIQSDASFYVGYISGGTQYGTSSSVITGATVPTVGYFMILSNATPVSITGNYTLYDMNTEAVTSLTNGQLNAGYYKLVANSGVANATYTNGLTNVTYNFYNGVGQLVANIPPNGVKLLGGTGYTNYSTVASIPYVSLFSYDAHGRPLTTTEPDGGSIQFIYRADGKPRFSQNALQAANGSYSYVNYDIYGRAIESGQYLPDASGIAFNSAPMTAILENMTSTGGLTTGTKTDVIMTVYDVQDNSHGLSGYTQDPADLGGAVSTTKRYSSILNNNPLSTNLVSQTWYSYDEEGKMVWTIKYIASLGAAGYKTTDFTYDAMSRLIKKVYQKNTAAETFVHYYQYDPANGDLWYVYTNTVDNQSTATLQAKYIYYLHGGLKRVELATNLQGIDYTYTLQGALKAINNSNNNNNNSADPGGDAVTTNGFSPDVFGEVLDYYPQDYNNTRTSGIQPINGVNTSAIVPTESYGSNIKAMSWYSTKPSGLGGSNSPTAYVFKYDNKHQLVSSTWGTNLNFSSSPAGFTSTSINQENILVPGSSTPGYDPNGNILYLQRTNSAGTQTDNLAYSYTPNTNKLASVTNTGTLGDSYTYTYDALGREISETTSAVSSNKYLKYNLQGNVTLVARDAAFTQPVAAFVYDEKGERIEKLTYDNSYNLARVTYYYDDVIYTQSVNGGSYGTLTPQEYEVRGANGRLGVYLKPSNLYTYQLTDHLGNIRAVVAQTGAVQTASDYYPFGMVILSLGSTYRYGYQGQNSEADGETGWNNFLLRMYNPRLGRWVTLDPQNQFASGYTGMANNPVIGTDPDGGFWEELMNFFSHGMWMSNDAWSDYKDDKDAGLNPDYTWSGNRLTGHGTVSYSDLDPDPTVTATRYNAVPDYFQTDPLTGKMYAAYLDLEVKVTAGARLALKEGGEGFDLNIFSIELYKYSFVEGSESVLDGFKDWRKFKFSQGLEGEMSIPFTKIGVGGSLEFEYNMAVTDIVTNINGKLGPLNMQVVYNAMEGEVASSIGIPKGWDMIETKGKAAAVVGVEGGLNYKIIPVPDNNQQSFINNFGAEK